MKLKITGFALLLIIPLFAPSTFAAQSYFWPRVSAKETYSDNIDRTDNDRQDDFTTNVSVGGTLSIIGKTSGMDLSFDPSYVWYQDNTSDNTWRLPVELNVWSDFSRRTRFEFFNRFVRSEDPADDEQGAIREEDGEILAPGDSTVRRERDPFWTNYATARIDHQFGTDDSVNGRLLYSLRREDGSNPGENENDRFSPSAGLNYWFGPKWGTTLDATYTRATFKNSDDFHDIAGIIQLNRRFTRTFEIFGRYAYTYRDNDGDDQDEVEGTYQIHAPSAGLNYALTRDSRISLGVGYYYQTFDESDFDDEEGFFVNSDFYKLWDYKRWSARVRGLAGLDRNDFGNERLGFEWFAGVIGNASYNFSRHFFGNVTGRYRYSDFINAAREDNRYSVGAGLGWVATRWMTLSLDYMLDGLDSTGTEDFYENRVWLSLTLQPDKPWRW